MFCKTTRIQVLPENLHKLTGWIKDKWAPLISRQAGLKGAFSMNKSNGEIMLMMLWLTEAHVQDWNDNQQHKQIVKEVEPLITNIVWDYYEVQHAIITEGWLFREWLIEHFISLV